MPGYQVKLQRVSLPGLDDLTIRSLIDDQQFADPGGAAAAVGICSASWPLFGQLWPSGRHLAMAIGRRPLRAGERILEVGCGLALASLVGHRRGACMTASDRHPLARSFLEANVRLNGLPPLPYCYGDWRDRAQRGIESAHGDVLEGLFDLIIGSDVLYQQDEAGVLPQFLAAHATQIGEVLIVDPDRGNRAPFSRRMAGLGYDLERSAIRDPLGPCGPYSGSLLRYRRC